MCNPSLAALRVLIIKQTCFQSLGLYALERSSPDTFGLPLSVWRQANLKKDARPEVTSTSPSTLILLLDHLALAGHQVIGWIGRPVRPRVQQQVQINSQLAGRLARYLAPRRSEARAI